MPSVLDSLKKMSPGPRRFAAVDFDGRQLRIVYAERVGTRARILKLAAVAIPDGFDIEDPEEIGHLLGSALKDMRLRNVGVLMNVPRTEAVLKPLTLPRGAPQGDLAGMIYFQMEKELPFRPEEAVIDFTIERHYDIEAAQGEQDENAGTDVLVAAARLPVVDHYRRIAEAAGVKLLRLGLRPYANVRCVDASTKRGPKETVLVVHFGADETEIDMLVGSALSFSRSAAVKIPSADAEPHELAQSVRLVAMEVVRSVQSYEAVERGGIDMILVAGGTGVEAVAAEELSRRLGAPCELFNPTAALGLGEVDNPSAFISALGLAVGHCGAEQLPFDFLEPKRPRVDRNWAKIAAIVIAAVLLLALTAGVTAASIHLGNKEAVVEEIQGRYNKEKGRKKDLLRLKKRVESISGWQDNARDWLTHWAYLSALFPACTDAYVSSLKTSADGSMSFTVKARESKIITDIGKRLTEAGYKFQPGRLATSNDAFGYPYSADVRVFADSGTVIELNSVKPIPRPADDDSVNQLMKVAIAAAQRSNPAPAAAGGTAARSPSPPAPRPTPGGSYRSGGGPKVDPAAREEIRRYLLGKYDRNKDGKLDKRELRSSAYYYVGRKWLKQFDRDGNGRLDGSEYKGVGEYLRQFR